MGDRPQEWDTNQHRRGYNQTYTVEDLERCKKNRAARLNANSGQATTGPYSHFEWGMINGKLSALRWLNLNYPKIELLLIFESFQLQLRIREAFASMEKSHGQRAVRFAWQSPGIRTLGA